MDSELEELEARLSNDTWFDEQNYLPSKDPALWAVRIYRRLCLEEEINAEMPVAGSSDEALVRTRQLRGFIGLFDPVGPADFSRMTDRLGETRAVEELSLQTVLDLQCDVEDMALHVAERAVDTPIGFDGFVTKTSTQQDPHIDFGGRVPVLINVEVDLDTIIEQMTELVAQLQGNLHVRALSEYDYADWAKYQTLAQFDVRLADRLTGRRRTRREIARLIWPYGPGDADTLRKTAEGHMSRAMRMSTVQRLRARTQSRD